jgi:hypothetical protein
MTVKLIPGEDLTPSDAPTETSLDVGTDQTTSDETPPTTSTGEISTASAPDTSADEPKSMEEAISRALNAPTDPAPADEAAKAPDANGDPSVSDESSEASDDAAANGEANDGPDDDLDGTDLDAENSDPTDEEIEALRPKARRRVKQLLRQRETARKEAQSLKPAADSYGQIRTFMERNDMHDREVADLFKLGADLKSGDPIRLQAFLDQALPAVRLAQERLGLAVPLDLQSQVDAGEMTGQAAAEVAKARHTAAIATARLQRQDDRTAQRTQVEQTQAQQFKITQAVTGWATEKSQSDPDFAQKQAAMRRVAQALVAEKGTPTTPEQAVQYANEAYAEATNLLRPRRVQTRPTPTASAAPSRSGMATAPTSLADAIEQGLRSVG